ncbi:EAL domain-containing protein [Vibrio sp. SCSIO 43140]|uniref:putative bifunctional diguanylate cyclase/phosphodiesterase n=1 Tax=Vibrio sp. SCSIO 43140 TaxID=2819100 RepID=UPI0020762CF0|nr:bifunctional diguanylate cyclase/phosphodiesterase [Vibrio sp. SCSIO 43140]USD63383.1 EAL domain-containing protein [Vibrio sp. SCSIO 43140]
MSSKNLPTLQQFIDALDDHIWVKDANGEYIAVNEASEIAWQRHRNDIYGKTDDDLFDAERARHFKQVDDQIISHGSQHTVEECAALDKRGNEVWLETVKSPIHNESGDFVGIIGMTRNATRRKQVEARLSITSEIFNNFQEGMMITDHNARIMDVNRAFTVLTGYQESEVIGENPRFLQSGHHSRTFYTSMWDQLKEQGQWKGEFINRKKDGTVYPQMATISAITGDHGDLLHYICVFEDISLRKTNEEKLRRMAFFDPLTNLPNRAHLTRLLEQHIEVGKQERQPFATLFLDLDHFKHINDSKGHHYGDKLLASVAKRLTSHQKANGAVGRIGGDEFVMILTGYRSEAELLDIVDQTLSVFNAPFEIEQDDHICVSGSIGIALYPDDGSDSETLLKNADTAMYLAKKNGRNGYAFYSPDLTDRSVQHVRIQSALHEAVDRQQLSLAYQPQYRFSDRSLIGVEALLRWEHPDLGWIPPSVFIPIAEKTGLIQSIGAWVLRAGCEQGKRWLDSGVNFGKIAVNASALQLQRSDFVSQLVEITQQTGFPTSQLEIEITESFLLRNQQHAFATLGQLRELGIDISLDDFGTGYSSLSYLKGLPINKLKIDRSFINDVPSQADSNAIVQAIIAMAQALDLVVVAEGVEDQQQVEFLTEHGCQFGQGYVFSKPIDPLDFARLISNNK